MVDQLSSFVKKDIWSINESDFRPLQLKGINTLKIILLAAQGFMKDLCQLRASALTLYTLLSIVPVIAMLFGIAKGFGFEKKLENQLLEQASEQDTMMIQLIEFSQNMLANTKGGVVAGIGIVVLLWSVIKVIGNIEESFNFIWKIEKSRTLARKLTDYLSLMMFAPIMLVMSSSMTVFVKTKINWLISVIGLPEFGTRIVLFAMSFSPMIIMACLFSAIFLIMPNQKIQIKAGVIAGITTGILYQLVQWGYIALQLSASSYNAIYGSFAALPLFLIWLQLGWMVVLFGCEISFYVQNFESFKHNEMFSNLSFALKRSITLKAYAHIIQQFAAGKPAQNSEQIAEHLKLPLPVVEQTLMTLITCHLLVKIENEGSDMVAFQPARDINQIYIADVIRDLERAGCNSMPEHNRLDQFIDLNTLDKDLLVKQLSLS